MECGSNKNVVQHHVSYNNPELKILLCQKCHKQKHLKGKNSFSRGTIRPLREKVGMTREELAFAVGVSLTTIARWETTRVHPTKVFQKKLSQILGQ